MTSFITLTFLVVMLGIHVPAAWWWQRRMLGGVDAATRDAVQHDLRGYWVRLILAQAVVILGIGVWIALHPEIIWNFQIQASSGRIGFYAFHGLWWPFVFPLILRLDKSLRAHGVLTGPTQPGPVRTASLRARKVSEYLPSWSTPLEVAIVIIGMTVVAARAITAPDPNPALLWSAGMFAFWAVVFVVGYAFWIRTEVQQSYSWLAETATEEEIEAHRRFRVRGIFAMQIAGAATFFAASAMVIEVARGTISGSTVGLIGGIGGAVLGIGGGVLGTLASLRAAKLQRAQQYREQGH
ncbi:MAG: hypothetical protein AMXMBFR82_38370 [Candidatus Hydrogenedentota bacterium]